MQGPGANGPVLQVEGLTKHFPIGRPNPFRGKQQFVHAVENVSFTIPKGQTLALVGESGSGKSTIARLILGLIEPTSGTVIWKGRDTSTFKDNERKALHREMQIIFQDPLSSLNPRKSIRQILSDPIKLHRQAQGREIEERVTHLLATVGLTPPSLYIDRMPHEFSGGQRQRIGIARAISLNPELLLADEPVSALDVSIQAQILNLLKKLQNDMGLSFLFITHNLAVARSVAQRVMVLYLGEVMENGPIEDVFHRPLHPYTEALLSATPIPNPRRAHERKRIILQGEMPSPVNPPSGCRFHTRCPYAMPVCSEQKPALLPAEDGRLVACHLIHPVDGSAAQALGRAYRGTNGRAGDSSEVAAGEGANTVR